MVGAGRHAILFTVFPVPLQQPCITIRGLLAMTFHPDGHPVDQPIPVTNLRFSMQHTLHQSAGHSQNVHTGHIAGDGTSAGAGWRAQPSPI